MWPIVTLLTLSVATAGNLGLEQAGRANRSVLDAIVFYADPLLTSRSSRATCARTCNGTFSALVPTVRGRGLRNWGPR